MSRLERLQLETFGERLYIALRRRNLTAAALSAMIRYEKSEVSNFVSDRRLPPLPVAIAMAKALDVSLDWLCGLKDRKEELFNKEED